MSPLLLMDKGNVAELIKSGSSKYSRAVALVFVLINCLFPLCPIPPPYPLIPFKLITLLLFINKDNGHLARGKTAN